MKDTTEQQQLSSQLLTIHEAVRLTCFSRAFLYQEISAGRLRSLKIGRNRRIRAEDVEAWIKLRTQGGQ